MILKLKQTPGIYLVGFMASGKTTIGRMLAGHIGWQFADLDEDIVATQKATIAQLFETLGEPGFRAIETDALNKRTKTIKSGRPTVLALGGGAYVQPANAAALEGCGISIWLDTPMDVIERRVGTTTHRPLAVDPVFFRELYLTRREAYAKAAYTVPVTSDDPWETVKSILALPLFD
jgi:shikimate kinase